MSGLTTRHSEFLAVQNSFTGPIDARSISAGPNNVMGSWVDLLNGTVANDSYGILIEFEDGSTAGSAVTLLADIGVDFSGGTSYGVLIPFLNACCANFVTGTRQAGYQYYFPIFIKAGSRIACRAQTGLAVAQSFNCRVSLMQKPTHPEAVKVGTYVDAIGVVAASSRGTIASPSENGVKGAWAFLGSAPRDGWYIQPSVGIDDPDMQGQDCLTDFATGDGVTMRQLIDDLRWGSSANEDIAVERLPEPLYYATIRAGEQIFARSTVGQPSSDSGYFAMAYVVGGG